MSTHQGVNAGVVRPDQEPSPTLAKPRIPSAELNGGLREKDLSDPNVPVSVLITAYQQIQLNDFIDLRWGDVSVATQLVNQDHIDQGSITLNVSASDIQDGEWVVDYLITSPNGQNQYKSLPLDIRVKTDVPGDPDPVPSTPENENLIAVIGVPEVVNTDNVGAITATVSRYSNMSEGDTIKLSWGGQFIVEVVKLDQVGKAIELSVPQAIIEAAGAGPVIIEYEIRDVVNNWSLWSLKFSTDVEIGSDLLLPPVSADLNDDGKLDLAELGIRDALVEVLVYTGMDIGDEVTLSWEARLPSSGVIGDSWMKKVASLGRPLSFDVPNKIARESAMGTVVLKYTVISRRGPQYSKRSTFEVIGQAQTLLAPEFKEAMGTELDLADIPDSGATVTVKDYPGMDANDRVELFIYGYDDKNNPFNHYDHLTPTLGQPIVFTVIKEYFNPLVKGGLEALYRVNGDPSDTLELDVVGEVKGTLIAPSVTGAVGGQLDPDDVPTGTTTIVDQYQGKAKGDRITLTWAGLPEASLSKVAEVDDTNLTKPISFDIAYQPYIIDNLDVTVGVSYVVERAAGGSPSSVELPILVHRKVGEGFVAPQVVEAQADGTTLFPFNARNGATVRVAYTGMTASDSIVVSYNGSSDAATFTSQPKPGNAGGSVDFTVPPEVIGASQGTTPRIHYAVTRGIQPPVPSRPLDLKVTILGEGRLTEPAIPQIYPETGELDLTKFAGNATVTLAPWPLMGVRQLYWIVVSGTLEGGLPTSFYLADAQAVNQGETSTGLIVTLPRTQLERLEHASTLIVSAKVAFDRNRDESRARVFPPCETRLIKDDDSGVLLPEPEIEHAKGDELDPADAPNGTTITVSKDVLLRGDRLVTRWIGPNEQEGVDSHTDTRNISDTEADKDQIITISANLITANLDQVVDVGYKILNRNRQSRAIDLNIRSAAADLPDPEVVDAPAGTLDPINARAKAVVRVSYPGMLATDDIQVKWVGTSGNGTPTIAPVKGDTSGTVSVDIPASAVGANIGKNVKVSYTRTRGGQPNDSGTLDLRVGFIQSEDLDTPELDHDEDGELDLNSFQGDTVLRVKPWPFIAAGQRYWLEGRGTLSAGGNYEHDFRTNVTVQPGEVTAGLELTVQRSELVKLELDKPFRLVLKVNFEGINDRTVAQGFPVRVVTVIEGAGGGLRVPEVEKATGPENDQLDMKDFYRADYVTVTVRQYPNMKSGDTVRVRWANPRFTYRTEIETVVTPGDMEFKIPRMELIDSIGQIVPVSYTVVRGTGQPVEPSDVLTLTVARQAIELPPPRYTAANRQVSVLYTDQDNGHTAQVRWQGVILRQTGTLRVVKGTPTLFTIDQLWVSENTGNTVLINYSVSRQRPDEDLLFSQVLRLAL